MSKKILALLLALAMTFTLCIGSVSAASIPASPWDAMDAEAVVAGTDANWKKSGSISLYSDETYGTGLIAAPNGQTRTTYDPAFIGTEASGTTDKRAWGSFASKNTITAADTPNYVMTFDHTMVQGAYTMSHGGVYLYLRANATSGNYLENRFAVIIKRDSYGATKIGLKSANTSAITDASLVDIGLSDVDLLNCSIKVVDDFDTDIIKIYATNNKGIYKLIGTVALNISTKTAVLTSASGSSLTATGYANSIKDSECTPWILLNEYPGMISNIVVSYPSEDPKGLKVTPGGGSFITPPKVSITALDAGAEIYYTVDGTDPIENIDNAYYYSEGEVIDLNPDGLPLPLDVTLKAVENYNGVFSDVVNYTYTLLAESGSFPIDVDAVASGSDNDYLYEQSFVATTFDENSTVNDAFTISGTSNWSAVYSKNTIPAEAGSSITSFKIDGTMDDWSVSNTSCLNRGIYLSLRSSESNSPVSTTTPYAFFTAKRVGFRNSLSWGTGCTTVLPYGIDLDLADGKTHDITFIDDYNGDAYLIIDGNVVAVYSIDGTTLTMTNAAGESISRTGIKSATDNFINAFGLMHDVVNVGDYTVAYPAESIPEVARVTLDVQDSTVIAGSDDIKVTAECDYADAVLYYTTDGTIPTLESEVYTDGVTVSFPEEGKITVTVRPYRNGTWGMLDSVTFDVIVPYVEYNYTFDDDSYLTDWGQNITAANTTIFTPNAEGKLVPGNNYSMINFKSAVASGKANILSFDFQDLDANPEDNNDDWLPLGVVLRHKNPSEWFNSTPINSGIYLMFNRNMLGLKTGSSVDTTSSYQFIDVDADFTTETKVIIKDSVENDLIGIYVQDIAGTSEPKLIAYVSINEVDTDGTIYPHVTLSSTLGGEIKDITYRADRYSKATFRPVFMTYAASNGYSIDNVSIYVDNANTAVIEAPVSLPVFEETQTGSNYYKLVKINATSINGVDIYYTLDGTEPSKENGTLYNEDSYVIISTSSTLKAIAYDKKNGSFSEIAETAYTVVDQEYCQYAFDPAATLAGTDANWTEDGQNNRDAYIINDDGSITFDGVNSSSNPGGVSSLWTKNSLTASANGVVITEFDAKNWLASTNHNTIFVGVRNSSSYATAMTDNSSRFFIKLSGTKIAIKNESWGSSTADYVETGVDFDASSSEYQHYTIIDDKINNVVRVFGNGYLLGTFTFSTTTNANDTVTLTTPAGNTVTRTYSSTIPTDGQFYIGQAYTSFNLKNLISYSGSVVPEYTVTFNPGEYGTLNGEAVINVAKYTAITKVPSITTDAVFEGWSEDGGATILSSEEVANLVPTGNKTFTAIYSGVSIDNFELVPSVIGTSPVYVDTFSLNGSFKNNYDVYYTLDGTQPTEENATLWDGKFIKLTKNATLKAFATANGASTAVVTKDITVADNEYYYDKMDNTAIAENYSGITSTDGKAFRHSSNRSKDSDGNYRPETLVLNSDGSVRIDGKNYGGGTGVSTTYPATGRWDSKIENSKTTVYSFNVRNADELSGTYKNMYIGVRVPSDAGYGALVNNKNPQIVLGGDKVGYKFGTWGATNSITYAENVPEGYAGICGSEWVNITVVDDRVANVIKIFADGTLLATYTVDGTKFTMTDVAGKTYTATYSSVIDDDGSFYVGSANYSFDLDEFEITTGNTIPEFSVTFNVGENGTTSDETSYTYNKYDLITAVPEVIADDYYTFNGWKIGDNAKVYSDLEIIKMDVVGDIEFVADYTLNPVKIAVTAGSAKIEKGRTQTVKLNVEGDVAVSGTITLVYNDSLLVLNAEKCSENVTDNGDGSVTVTISAENTSADIAFAFADGIAAGTATMLQIAGYELTAVNGEPISITANDGTITSGVLVGDVDLDGKISVYDAVCVLKAIASIDILSEDALEAANVNGDEAVTLADASQILKYIARMITSF